MNAPNLPGYWGAEPRGWLVVPRHRSLRTCPNVSLVRSPAGAAMAVLADLPVDAATKDRDRN